MTFLPIVERELRVAGRQRGTYWTRLVVALLAVIIGAVVFFARPAVDPVELGKSVFLGLGVVSLAYGLVAGRLFTADCLSFEKREGTLGLLFLTDLRGHDVVLGKLAATSLNGFYGLLAVFPVLAVPLLMGGITNGEFWRMVLVLTNTCLFSLAIGLFVSALCREARVAFAANFFLLLFLVLAGPVAGGSLMAILGPELPHPLFFTCPGYGFALAFDAAYRSFPVQFWCSLAVIHALTWLLVWSACRIAPRSWQDKPAAPVANQRLTWREFWRTVSFGGEAGRAPFRKHCLDLNAFYWHAARARLKPVQVWVFLAVGVVWWLCCWMLAGDMWRDAASTVTTALIVNSTLKLWITLEAGQRLAEDKRVGALELLLSTPLTAEDILRGQFLALRRQFLKPVLVVVALELGLMAVSWKGNWAQDAQTLAVGLGGTVMLVLDSVALSWVAIWTALTARAQQQAIVNAVGLILVLPIGALSAVVVIALAWTSSILDRRWEPGWQFFFWSWFFSGLAADFFFGGLARRRLLAGFHQLAAQRTAGSIPPPAAARG